MCRIWMYLFCALGVILTPGERQASAMEITTPKEITALNGTDVVLKCTFKSTYPVKDGSVSVSWLFRPLAQEQAKSFFYYQTESYPPKDGPFKGRVTWSGNVMKNDVSITLHDVQYNFNGTYTCQVLNPPDIQGLAGEIRLQVVQSVKFSEMGILATAVGGAILIVLVILAVYLTVRYCRNRRENSDLELPEAKQPSVW
ncbi:myelin protein zero-like protein 2b [Trichomycterus rosablanca]|uniref:myelin protein zero-like protein 2b n=1 Tax=Trichomycterus rosablanca TaxID=2290929 RepID=UPI002F35897C